MRVPVCVVAVFTMLAAARDGTPAAPQEARATTTVKVVSGKDSPAAERTRAKLLKAKVTVEFKNVMLREVLKEFAAQVEMQAERPVMWTYTAGVPADKPVTYACKNKPLDAALDEVFKGLGLGYVVVSQDDQPRDGWVRITRGAERGYGVAAVPSTIDDDDEKKAATRLGLAKDLIEKGKPADAKAVLMLVVNKFPQSKAAAEAKELLEKLNK
jgi:hypothetical protein